MTTNEEQEKEINPHIYIQEINEGASHQEAFETATQSNEDEDPIEVFLDVYETAIELGNNHDDAVEIALEAVEHEEE